MQKHNDKTVVLLNQWITAQARLREETGKALYPIKPIAKCDRKRMPCKMKILDNHEFSIFHRRISVLAMRVESIKEIDKGVFAFFDPFGSSIALAKTGYPITGVRMSDAVHDTITALETYGIKIPTSAMSDVTRAKRAYYGLYSFGPSADSVNSYQSKRVQCQLPVFRGSVHPK